jgi:hypothetical protein
MVANASGTDLTARRVLASQTTRSPRSQIGLRVEILGHQRSYSKSIPSAEGVADDPAEPTESPSFHTRRATPSTSTKSACERWTCSNPASMDTRTPCDPAVILPRQTA